MKKEKNLKVLHIDDLRKNLSDMTVDEIKERRKLINKKKKKKSAIRITAFLVIVAVLVLMLTPIFTVKWFEVTGNTKITDKQILEASDLDIGDNLFRFNLKKTKDKIKAITYIDSVKIVRWLPDGIKITVTERTPVAALKSATGFLTVDVKGKIIESVKKTSLPVIENIKTATLKPGEFLNEKQVQQIEELVEVARIINEFEMNDRLTEFGIDKSGNYKFVIDGNKNVVLGEETRIDYKLKMLKAVIDELSPTEEGTIDLSKEGEALYSP